jgi:hypothetical protein
MKCLVIVGTKMRYKLWIGDSNSDIFLKFIYSRDTRLYQVVCGLINVMTKVNHFLIVVIIHLSSKKDDF